VVEPSREVRTLCSEPLHLLLTSVENEEAPDSVTNILIIHPTRNFAFLRCGPDVLVNRRVVAKGF
jgi:hypothetical protein